MRRWIAEVQRRYGVSIGIQVAMPGHAHLVVETPRGSRTVSEAMRFLSSKIALDINRTFRLRGPVFVERFWSRVVSSMSDLLRTVRYIAENPVKAGYVDRPADWLASSIRDFLHGPCMGLWRFRGYMFATLGFLEDPVKSLRDILSGEIRPVTARGGRQQRLPFVKGLPARNPP